MRILFVSSTRFPWFESADALEHFKNAPYSIDAIGYNLSLMGHKVAWAGWKRARSLLGLAAMINGFKPDVVYTYGAAASLNPVLARKFRLCRHEFLVVHGWDDEYGVIWRSKAGLLPGMLFSLLERAIIRLSDHVVTLSRFLQAKGLLMGVNCHYIPNGADIPDRERISGSIALEGRFKIVYTGDKARWKRTGDICKAMASLPADIKLYLTGRNEKYLEKYRSENCVFLGYLPKEEQLNVMKQADAFVVTANQDCNAKIHEYLRWEKPILGYDGRANMLFTNGHDAILVPEGDYAPAIRRLADNPALCRSLAANAKRNIPVMEWREIAALFEEFFASCLASRRRDCRIN